MIHFCQSGCKEAPTGLNSGMAPKSGCAEDVPSLTRGGCPRPFSYNRRVRPKTEGGGRGVSAAIVIIFFEF